ncbi:MAG: hypothetical protein ACT4PG_04410 [Panacagrimonas sp.]
MVRFERGSFGTAVTPGVTNPVQCRWCRAPPRSPCGVGESARYAA